MYTERHNFFPSVVLFISKLSVLILNPLFDVMYDRSMERVTKYIMSRKACMHAHFLPAAIIDWHWLYQFRELPQVYRESKCR
jgi:hypothetical protein